MDALTRTCARFCILQRTGENLRAALSALLLLTPALHKVCVYFH